MTSAVSSPIGRVIDVSREGFRIRADKRSPFKTGETHEIVLRAGAQQIRAIARVQWVRRTSLFPMQYELGLAVVDPRPGVGDVILQLGQFGCVDENKSAQPAQPAPAHQSAKTVKAEQPAELPTDQPSIEVVDLYSIIGVEPDANEDAIRSAFRKLAKTEHPDHNKAPDAAERFAQITSAYSVLRDPQRRKWYDEMRAAGAAA